LQLDEIRSFSGGKIQPTWVFTAIVVWSRLWVATTVGRRTYKNTYQLLADTLKSSVIHRAPFITTDGFEYYGRAIGELLPGACVHGQVIKQWRKNRVASITRSLRSGMPSQLDAALLNSEDSAIINTSFVERLNLTIRRGSAYLQRKTPCHSRRPERLADQLELLRCYYNFVRPHRALKFGSIMRTPAMQAGIASRSWTFRMIFMAAPFDCSVLTWVCLCPRTGSESALAMAA
jgi:IS1 family transposase